jgi:hypothetical protein
MHNPDVIPNKHQSTLNSLVSAVERKIFNNKRILASQNTISGPSGNIIVPALMLTYNDDV